jgi:site-specific DNA-cytosine methylase
MGFSDEAFDLAQPNQSNSSLYHQAGDSIVVNVLMAIFKELL